MWRKIIDDYIFYGLSRMLQFLNFLLIDATDRSKISSDQKRFFIALCLYPLSFFANTPFNKIFLNYFILIFIINRLRLASIFYLNF